MFAQRSVHRFIASISQFYACACTNIECENGMPQTSIFTYSSIWRERQRNKEPKEANKTNKQKSKTKKRASRKLQNDFRRFGRRREWRGFALFPLPSDARTQTNENKSTNWFCLHDAKQFDAQPTNCLCVLCSGAPYYNQKLNGRRRKKCQRTEKCAKAMKQENISTEQNERQFDSKMKLQSTNWMCLCEHAAAYLRWNERIQLPTNWRHGKSKFQLNSFSSRSVVRARKFSFSRQIVNWMQNEQKKNMLILSRDDGKFYDSLAIFTRWFLPAENRMSWSTLKSFRFVGSKTDIEKLSRFFPIRRASLSLIFNYTTISTGKWPPVRKRNLFLRLIIKCNL